jgi:hypothetical protein
MNLFPGLDPENVPPMETYTNFLADQASTLLLIALTRARYCNLKHKTSVWKPYASNWR